MKKTFLKNLKTGFFAILPAIVFIWLIRWLIRVFLNIVDGIISKFPYSFDCNPIVLQIIGSIVLILLIIIIGALLNSSYIGTKIKLCFNPIIKRIPVLKTLYKVFKQVNESLDKSKSFKKVVLVRFPTEDCVSLGFITSEDLEVFDEAVGKELVSVFVPTTPNPTNGFLFLTTKESVILTTCPVEYGIAFVVSMGTVGATKKIVESYSKV